MGIYYEKNLNDTHHEIIDVADQCFYCGEALTLPAVYWAGFPSGHNESGYIWFHPRCCEKLCLTLLNDAEKLL